jgi:hypothetical protein
MVLIRVADALRVQAPVRADLATAADMAAHEEEIRRPFPLGRGLQCRDEAWRPEPALVRLVRRAAGGGLTGFAVLGEIVLARRPDGSRSADLRGPAGGKVLLVTDSWAQDVGSAAALLRSVAEEARDLGYTWVLLSCRRDDVLARLSVLAGGELRWSAGQERDWSESGEDVDAFYLADLRLALEQMLPELNARWRECAGSAPAEICLSMEGDEVGVQLGPEVKLLDDPSLSILRVRLPRKAMTQAIVGYACPGELVALHEGCQVPEACSAALDALFVARQPHLVHEGLSFAGPERFGLVP